MLSRSLHRQPVNVQLFGRDLFDQDDQQDHHQYTDHCPNPHPSARPSAHPSVRVVHHPVPFVAPFAVRLRIVAGMHMKRIATWLIAHALRPLLQLLALLRVQAQGISPSENRATF
jgi:hypothetical protein